MGLNGLLSTGYVGDGLDKGVTGKKVADQRFWGVLWQPTEYMENGGMKQRTVYQIGYHGVVYDVPGRGRFVKR